MTTLSKDEILRGSVEMPKTQWLGDIPGFSRAQHLAYGDARALAASEQDRVDAERYRWLRDNRTNDGLDGQIHLEYTCDFEHYDCLDASIDNSMKRGEA